jgi:GR25 family glycosyltransferase involved in LPS biosynthesis/glycosyltransferase involved in cell wall biosynthesis
MPQTLCLNMIVKDEAHILRETLAHLLSVFPITYWVIDDTGSTDGTQDLIREFFAERGIGGELFETPWRNFGYNRSQAFAHAHGKTDYVLVWDADDSVTGTLRLPAPLTADSYPLQFGNPTGFRYQRAQIFNNRKRWHYVGVLHEYAACLDPVEHGPLVTGDYYCVSGKSGNRSKDPEKYRKDAAVLEQGLLDEPDNARYAFYCANSYKDAGDTENAIRMYKRVLTMNGWAEEKYLACVRIYDLSGCPANLHYLVESHRHCPERVEGIKQLVRHYVSNGMNAVALAYYGLVQNFYESRYTGADTAKHLFVAKADFDFFLPYHTIIAAIRLNRWDLAATLYDRIFRHGHTAAGAWWNNCLFHNLLLVAPHLTPNLDFLHRMLKFRAAIPYHLDDTPNKAIAAVIDRHRDLLGAPLTDETPRLMIQDRQTPRVLLTITSCKRFDLFQKTMNSVLRTWTDLDAVDSFLCVDDNSSEEDRTAMHAAYPFFEFYMKTPAERGHRASMNIIWERLKATKPAYWIHLEDDWLFVHRGSYVRDAIATLERPAAAAANVHQLLYNRNYAELYDWGINGGVSLEPGLLLHQKDAAVVGRNCAYWPHYSFRPSVVRTAPILALGNFDSANTFFERDYADRWFAAGHRSAFFDDIRCLHIGRLTSERTGGVNAYILNGTDQFEKNTILVVNLERRPDRRREIEACFSQAGITDYSFFKAIDGNSIVVTPEIQFLFTGDAYVRRKGVMGCALSHYRIWQQLLADASSQIYTVLEDDITLAPDFKQQYDRIRCDFMASGGDILFLGRHVVGKHREEGIPSIYPLEHSNCAGGTFGYIITKKGAQQLVEYANTQGILRGIDFYILKQPDTFKQMMVNPPIVLSEWVQQSGEVVDSDIQRDYSVVDLSAGDWVFFAGVDHTGDDFLSVGRKPISELVAIADAMDGCCAFNTLGFFKLTVNLPLTPSPWFRGRDGVWVKRSALDLSVGDWVFFAGVDHTGDDILSVGRKPISELTAIANAADGCRAFNTLGFLKSTVRFPLTPSRWFRGHDGVFVRKPRVELHGFWGAPSTIHTDFADQLAATTSAVVLTREGETPDYQIVLGKPMPSAKLDPARTLTFHLEPWCGASWQTWGAKTWGEWASPDPAKFFHVQTAARAPTPGFWQLTRTPTGPVTTPKIDQVACILSAKKADPGQKHRVEFLRYLESTAPDIPAAVFGRENYHGLAAYRGPVTGAKEDILLPAKYYFMCENNAEANYVTEKLWEPILCESLCFYWGAPNIADIVDPAAYIQLDMTDYAAAASIIREAIATDEWSRRLPAIRAAKHKLLTEQALGAVVERVFREKGVLGS